MEFYGSIHDHTDRSNFRIRDSINRLNELCWYAAKELKHNFIAITDHETIATAIECQEIEQEIRKEFPNFKVIRGNEIYLCRNGLSKENYIRGEDKFYHFILLAKDAIGHEQIREISTRAWNRCFLQGRMMRVPTYYSDLQDIIGKNPGHVIFSQACIGSKVAQLVLEYNKTKNKETYEYIEWWVQNIAKICGKENYFLEVQPSFSEEQIIVNQFYKTLSEKLDIPVVISLDAHYLKKEDEPLHHAFLTAQEGERETSEFYASTYMMSREEIHKYMDEFIGQETVSKWMNNTKLIYDMCCDYDLTHPLHIPYLPKTIDHITNNEFNLFKDKIKELEYFYTSPHQSDKDMCAAIVKKILTNSEYNNNKTFSMIDECLTAIRLASEKQNTQWSAYLLNLRDYVNVIWEKGNSLTGISRGSGGGFILLNILGITQLNPAREKAPLRAWRFLNPERVSPLDVDLDCESGKRPQIYTALQEAYGKDRVSKVLTLRTEKSKSALLTACRGLNIDPDDAAYLASFIKADRGIPRSLKQTFYGDPENDILPDKTFQDLMTNRYSKVWEVALKIENLCCGIGSHAGGVIFYDEPITKTTALMQTTNGDVITQFDLHQAEKTGLIKIDLLSIEALDKIRACLDLLIKYKYVNSDGKTLRQIYEDTLGTYNLERDDPKMWQMLYDHKITSLFQMEEQSGIKGITLTHPTSVEELASINSIMRLMATEKGAKQPLDIFAERKNNPQLWENEMISYGLSIKEREWLHKWLDNTYGICETQETLMSMLQEPEIGEHSLLFSDRVRKSIAKKKPEEFLQCQKEFFQTIQEKQLSLKLAHYTWDVVFAMSRGYSFNYTRRIKTT